MNCPTCNSPLPPGRDTCAACAAPPPVEGALAPDLSRRPARTVEPIRELPGKRRRERTWKDEVRERVDRRRREVRGEPPAPDAPRDSEPRAPEPRESVLPLFPEAGGRPLPPRPSTASRSGLPARRAERRPPRHNEAEAEAAEPQFEEERVRARGPQRGRRAESVPEAPEEPSGDLLDRVPLHADTGDLDDLPQRPDPLELLGDPPAAEPARRRTARARAAAPAPAPDDDARDDWTLQTFVDETPDEAAVAPTPALVLDEPPEEDWTLDSPPPARTAARPLERPARALERAQAALIDLAVLAAMTGVVVYFAGRVAQVPLIGLRPAWPYLAAYLVFLGLAYAVYFTGTSGQTVGKIVLGLRVVDTSGQAPGYPRALLRAALGALGTLAAGTGLLTVVFDPAHRALHDRILRTRVVSSRRE